MLKRLVELVRCTSGTAAIEAIIVLPLAISLMAGGVEFGRLFSAYSTVDKSMRDAARYLARVPRSATNGWGLDNAKCLALYGKIPCDYANDTPLIPGWDNPNTVQCSTCSSVAADTSDVIDLRADVSYSVFMLSAVGLPNIYTLSAEHEEQFIGE